MIQFSSLNSQTRFGGESISPLLQVFKKMSQEDYLSPLVWDMHGQHNKAPSNSNRQTKQRNEQDDWVRMIITFTLQNKITSREKNVFHIILFE